MPPEAERSPYYPGLQRPPAGGSDRPVGLRELVDRLLARWKLWSGIALAVTVLAVALTFVLPSRYEANSRLKMEAQERDVTDPQADRQTDNPAGDQARIDSEVEVLQSRDIARAVARALGLAADPEYDGVAGQSGPVPEKVVDAMLKKLSVKREPNTYIVDVAFSSRDPDKAATVVNAIVDTYIQQSVATRIATVTRQAQALDGQLKTLGSEVQDRETAIAGYRAQAGLLAGANIGTATDQQISSLSTQLASAESQAAVANANLAAARAQSANVGASAVSSVLSSGTVADLRRQRAELLTQQGDVMSRYGERHPETIKITQQLANNQRALDEEARRIISGLASEARAASASAASLRGQLAALRGEQAGNTRAAAVAEGLERQNKARQDVYDRVSEVAQRASQTQQNIQPLATVVERAVPPTERAFPKRSLFGALGIVLGLAIGFGVVFVIDLLRTTVTDAEQLERQLGVPFIASTPRLGKRQLAAAKNSESAADYVVVKPMSSYAEALRTLRSTLSLGLDADGAKVIAITSALPAEGKTNTAIALGRIMAMAGDSVVLVDCDLRRGRHIEGVNPRATLIDYLSGQATLDDAITIDPAVPGLAHVAVAGPSFTPVDLFSGDRMPELLKRLAARYRYVLLDTAPLLAVADTRQIAKLADTTVMIVRANYTPARAAVAALKLLGGDGSPVLGAVLSIVPRKSGTRSSEDPLYYYSMYRDYQDA